MCSAAEEGNAKINAFRQLKETKINDIKSLIRLIPAIDYINIIAPKLRNEPVIINGIEEKVIINGIEETVNEEDFFLKSYDLVGSGSIENKVYVLKETDGKKIEAIMSILIRCEYILKEPDFRFKFKIPQYMIVGTLLVSVGSSISIISNVFIGVSAYLQNENLITAQQGAILVIASSVISGCASIVAIFSTLAFNWHKLQNGETINYSYKKYKYKPDIILGCTNNSVVAGICIRI